MQSHQIVDGVIEYCQYLRPALKTVTTPKTGTFLSLASLIVWCCWYTAHEILRQGVFLWQNANRCQPWRSHLLQSLFHVASLNAQLKPNSRQLSFPSHWDTFHSFQTLNARPKSKHRTVRVRTISLQPDWWITMASSYTPFARLFQRIFTQNSCQTTFCDVIVMSGSLCSQRHFTATELHSLYRWISLHDLHISLASIPNEFNQV